MATGDDSDSSTEVDHFITEPWLYIGRYNALEWWDRNEQFFLAMVVNLAIYRQLLCVSQQLLYFCSEGIFSTAGAWLPTTWAVCFQ